MGAEVSRLSERADDVGALTPAQNSEENEIVGAVINLPRSLVSVSPESAGMTKSHSMTTLSTTVRLGAGTVEDDASSSASRTVGELRPKHGVVVTPEMNVAEAAKLLAAQRQDACLVLSSAGAEVEEASLEGILTDVDIVRKVLALGLEPQTVLVRDVMTRNPICVRSSSGVDRALAKMRNKHCRHLPVVDAKGNISGLLDIAKLLFDVMQAAQGLRGGQRQLADLFEDETVMRMGGAKGSGAAPTQRLMQAALLMAERRSALLVSRTADQSTVDGILTPKDLLFKAVAAGKPTHTVSVEEVMTVAPDVMPSSATVMQALHQLSTGGYRSVPVVEPLTGKPVGVLDVLALVEAALHSPEPERPVAVPLAAPLDVPIAAPAMSPPAATSSAAVVKVLAFGRTHRLPLALGGCALIAALVVPRSPTVLVVLGKVKVTASETLAKMKLASSATLASGLGAFALAKVRARETLSETLATLKLAYKATLASTHAALHAALTSAVARASALLPSSVVGRLKQGPVV